jgi:MSHA pilin protein MshD
MSLPRRMLGVTLVELVITLAIVALAVSALLGVMGFIAKGSGESLVMQQAEAIANAYLQEALSKPFNDPALPDGEAARPNFDDVNDYNGLNQVGARDAADVAIPALATYTVVMGVVNSNTLGGIPAAGAMLVTVTVTHNSGLIVTASGYKTNYTP